MEQNIKESTEKLKEMEIQSQCNGQQEDDYEEQEKKLRKYFSFSVILFQLDCPALVGKLILAKF